jgi:hypothetical protein
METQSGNSPSVRSPGDTSFNGVDRLAIINLFGAYAQSYDASKLDEFISLFTDKAELKYMNGDKVAADGLAQVTAAMPERVKAFKAAKMQRRHSLTSYAFTSQTDKDGGVPSVALTGYYEFTAVKEESTWKFSRWIARADQFFD